MGKVAASVVLSCCNGSMSAVAKHSVLDRVFGC